jgi:hypothetical protein
MAIREFDLSRLFVPGVTYAAFGLFELVAVIWHWPQVNPADPWLWAYLTVLVVVLLTGGYGWRTARRRPLDRHGRAPESEDRMSLRGTS